MPVAKCFLWENMDKIQIFIVNMLKSAFGTDHAISEHKYIDQCDPSTIPSELMPCFIYSAHLVSWNAISIALFCYPPHLALVMSLTSMKILTNMTHM